MAERDTKRGRLHIHLLRHEIYKTQTYRRETTFSRAPDLFLWGTREEADTKERRERTRTMSWRCYWFYGRSDPKKGEERQARAAGVNFQTWRAGEGARGARIRDRKTARHARE